ncbi:hypothetical protein N7931_15070 [Catenovulum sp. 2E275]|uniref:hypothetical protein n=1 Tax=Catenovulum sp. 2E275 TaxID=2980497 RepID=UPI0021CE76F2|nr:hypothetical protein [Catenovulum sp. 2E275]MCU4676954.1 hypothetical protein [Catenovulum sp. 2E275]
MRIFLVLLLLSGCSSIDNKIGYGVSFEVPIKASCLIHAIKKYEPFSSTIIVDTELKFYYSDNRVELEFYSHNLTAGYKLTIDGTSKGKSYKQFIQEAEETSKIVGQLVSKECS